MSVGENDHNAAMAAIHGDPISFITGLREDGTRGPSQLERVELAIATARADGYRAGLEAAAKECDERAALNEAIERDDPEYMESIPRMHEARECAASIRALAKEGR